MAKETIQLTVTVEKIQIGPVTRVILDVSKVAEVLECKFTKEKGRTVNQIIFDL